ncbi:MAG: glycosyltransferase family 2 protein [Myxococcota bacterium]|nr:glycosyltransferase family 2 protein [Myxococcota bacterium]
MSVVIAAHNEAQTIGGVIEGCIAVLGEQLHELIVVDDGSTDETYLEARCRGARVIRLVPNRGKGVALRRGIEQSTGDWLVFLDADGQDDPAEIPKLLDHAGPDVALVNGSRFTGTLNQGAISRPNYIGNLLMTGLLDLAFRARITDSQAGFRAIRGDIARNLKLVSKEYEIETEMLAQILRAGHRIVEVPVNRYARAAGRTDFRRIRNGMRILWTIGRQRML